MHTTIRPTIDLAHALLSERSPRARYAHAVLDGKQNWSGSDLRGKASRYGAGYAEQRAGAAIALRLAGGTVIPVEHGRLVSAVYVGQDDYGSALYRTRRRTVVVGTRCWCRDAQAVGAA